MMKQKKQSRAFKIAYRILLYVLVGLLVGFAIYNWNATKLLGNQMPMPFGVGVSVILSGSMEPELSVGDLVIITKTDEFYPGQVVVFQDKSILVIHRIIEVNGDELVTQGDANDTSDDPIKVSDVKGELAMTVPGVGKLVDVLRSPLVVLMLLFAMIYLLRESAAKEKQEKTDELDEIRRQIDELKKD